MCGDVCNKGEAKYYESAKNIFDYIKFKAGDRDIEFVMIPGNHDMCNHSFEAFDNFCGLYQKDCCKFSVENCYSKSIDRLNFIMANSSYHKHKEYGKVDVASVINNVSVYSDNILVTHHSTISEDETDSAAIRNIPRVLDTINNNNIIFHLHGHTHGAYSFEIGDKCKSIGVGAMFLAAEEMGSQFNLITVTNGKILKVCNYLYRIDRDKYIPDPVFSYEKEDDMILVELNHIPIKYK